MHVYVVNVALRAVEENALSILNCLFNESSGHTGPVGRYLVSANYVGVVCKVCDNYRFSAISVKSYYVYGLVGVTPIL